jgi:hypothetical protein
LLEWLTDIASGIVSGGIPIWWWDPSIHRSGRLLQIMRMIDRVMLVIGLRLCEDIVRGFVDICPIGRGRFSLTIPRIDSIHKLVEFDFVEMLWQDMI